MIYRARIQRMEQEILSLRESINWLIDTVNHLMVAQVDHPEYEAQAKNAGNLIRGRGWRIAQQRKMISEAEELQYKLKIMAEDYPAVADMLAKKGN